MTVPADPSAFCRNCNFFLGERPGNYCPHCGQETALKLPPARELVRRLAADIASPRGKLMRTLALLIFWPGELTRRYLAGRKRSYVLPLRLYFGASLVFFLVVKFFGAGSLVGSETGVPAGNAVAPGNAPKSGLQFSKPGPIGKVRFDQGEGGWDAPFLETVKCSPTSVQCDKVRAYMHDKYGDSSLRVVGRQVRDRVIGYAPNALFALLPVFALFTRLLYWRRPMAYGEHLVYAMHVHAFSFLLLLSIALLPVAAAEWLYLAGMIYFAIAMRRVFGGRWWATLIRYALIGICYPLLLSLAILLTLAAAIFI